MHHRFRRRLLCRAGFLLVAGYAFLLKGCGYYSEDINITIKTPLNKPSIVAAICGNPSSEICLTASPNDTLKIPQFEFYQGGTSLGTSTDGRLKVSGLTPDTAYTFAVMSKDTNNHTSLPSDTVTVRTAALPVKPSLSASLCGDISKEICLSASTSHNIISSYAFYLGTTVVGTSSDGNLKISGLTPDTSYSFTAKATDTLNRTSPSSDAVSAKTSAIYTVAISGKKLKGNSNGISVFFVATTDMANITNQSILDSLKATPYHSACTLSGIDISCAIGIPVTSAGYVILNSSRCGTPHPGVDDYVSTIAAVDKSNTSALLNLDRTLSIEGTEMFCFQF